MYREWSYFRTFVSNVEMTLVKTDLTVAARYVEALVAPQHRKPFETIRDEHDRTLAEITAVTGETELLDRYGVLKRTLAVRNVYLDPISHLQVALLRKARRAGKAQTPTDEDLQQALLLTVNGLAAGLRNTG
jgi:phosphoenolpyruvate carboxylase